jgi:hypothetical protein
VVVFGGFGLLLLVGVLELWLRVSRATKEGKKITAGRAVRDKREAEWLAATIKQALGVS